MPRFWSGKDGTNVVNCQACGKQVRQRGIALHLKRSKSCGDWIRSRQLKEDDNFQDSSIIDTVPFQEIVIPTTDHVETVAQHLGEGTNQSTGKDDITTDWSQQYYDDELLTDEEKAGYVRWFRNKHGVNPPVELSDAVDALSRTGEQQHHLNEKEDITKDWCQQYYDDELLTDEEKAGYVSWFRNKHGVNPP
jgi:hypothetical protein